MPIPGVHIETIANPTVYTLEQIERAVHIAETLQRGKFLLMDPPPHDCDQALNEDGVCHWCRRRPE